MLNTRRVYAMKKPTPKHCIICNAPTLCESLPTSSMPDIKERLEQFTEDYYGYRRRLRCKQCGWESDTIEISIEFFEELLLSQKHHDALAPLLAQIPAIVERTDDARKMIKRSLEHRRRNAG